MLDTLGVLTANALMYHKLTSPPTFTTQLQLIMEIVTSILSWSKLIPRTPRLICEHLRQ